MTLSGKVVVITGGRHGESVWRSLTVAGAPEPR